MRIHAATVAVAVLLVACSTSSETHTVTGTLVLEDPSGWGLDQVGDPCAGQRGYEHIQEGAEVVVTNESGRTLRAVGRLEPGQLISETECEFAFTIPGVVASEQYTFEVSDRGQFGYSADELEAAGWDVELRLTE